ncbi:P-loop containing nucleoside triphosphate hydrolase protein [Boletus edulis]|nr:P-loop containing nucleoside triphosphate hydrolase protein [Boletus edulis]
MVLGLTCIVVLNVTILLSTIRKLSMLPSGGSRVGRIMNRFSKDIEPTDQRLIPKLFKFQLVAGCWEPDLHDRYSTPIMLAFVFHHLLVCAQILPQVTAETFHGIPTIMAYGRETDFESTVGGLLDASNEPTFLRQHAEIWVTLRMEIMSSSIVPALAMLAHTKVVGSSTQFVLALTYSSTLTYLLLKSAANINVKAEKLVASQESMLDTVVEDNGSNYSVGQRQLLCLAAAILRNPKILLLDEATTSIDAGADVFIQQAMRRSCPHATILSVMHRLNDRILQECDKVLVYPLSMLRLRNCSLDPIPCSPS